MISQGMMLKLKNVATWPADSPRSLSVMVRVWFGSDHMPCAK